jgi:arginase
MRKCLAPFFIGRLEPGLEAGIPPFDVILPQDLAGAEPGSPTAINRINCAIRDFVAETVARREMPLVLSGDCLSAIGCLAGLQRTQIPPFLVWFDAHGDFHTPSTTQSGHLGGMPLAMITGRGDLSLLAATGMMPLPDQNVLLVGGRDLEPEEKAALGDSRIHQSRRIGDVLDILPRELGIWIHFDTDYLDPTDAPAMRYPAPGGIPASSVQSDLALLASRPNIIGVSISAWAPHLDSNTNTATTCWNVLSGLSPCDK